MFRYLCTIFGNKNISFPKNQIPCEAVVCGFLFLYQLRCELRCDVKGTIFQIFVPCTDFVKSVPLYLLRLIYIYKEAGLSVCLPVRPSVCVKHLGSNWTDFYEIWYFPKIVRKIQVPLRMDKNKEYFT
jgi:hypothetical protein